MMFPEFNQKLIDEKIEKNKSPGIISYLYDFEKGDFVIKDGKLVEIEDLDSVLQWVDKILLTQLKKYEIYKKDGSREYGSNIRDLVLGKKLPAFFIESEVKRDIEESLKLHSHIKGIEDFNYDHEATRVTFHFKLILVDGRVKDIRKEVKVVGR